MARLICFLSRCHVQGNGKIASNSGNRQAATPAAPPPPRLGRTVCVLLGRQVLGFIQYDTWAMQAQVRSALQDVGTLCFLRSICYGMEAKWLHVRRGGPWLLNGLLCARGDSAVLQARQRAAARICHGLQASLRLGMGISSGQQAGPLWESSHEWNQNKNIAGVIAEPMAAPAMHPASGKRTR
jgi:hypothetical protein